MRFSLTFLALVGATVAIPTRIARDVVVQDVEVDTVVDIVTDTVTVVGSAPTPAPAVPTPQVKNQQVAPAPQPEVHIVTVVQAAASPAPAPPAPAAPAPAPAAPAPAAPAAPAPKAQSPSANNNAGSNDGSPMMGSMSMLAVANKYRAAYKLPLFTWSSTLQANAQKTSDDNHGSQENHELNPGSFAQVLTPGNADISLQDLTPFEVAYVAGWLCEAPRAELGVHCPTLDEKAGLDVSGETGHADILNNAQYTKIGCGYTANGPNGGSGQWKGIFACDLA